MAEHGTDAEAPSRARCCRNPGEAGARMPTRGSYGPALPTARAGSSTRGSPSTGGQRARSGEGQASPSRAARGTRTARAREPGCAGPSGRSGLPCLQGKAHERRGSPRPQLRRSTGPCHRSPGRPGAHLGAGSLGACWPRPPSARTAAPPPPGRPRCRRRPRRRPRAPRPAAPGPPA